MVVGETFRCWDKRETTRDDHALVLEGFLYGTGVNATCFKGKSVEK